MFGLDRISNVKFLLAMLLVFCFFTSAWIFREDQVNFSDICQQYLSKAFDKKLNFSSKFVMSKTILSATNLPKINGEFYPKQYFSQTISSSTFFTTALTPKSLPKHINVAKAKINPIPTLVVHAPRFKPLANVHGENSSQSFSSVTSSTFSTTRSALIKATVTSERSKPNASFKVPPETLFPNSRFYGMIHMNTYGWALSESVSFEEDWEDWKNYFPELMDNIQKQKEQNPNQDEKLLTRKVLVKVSKTKYRFGDEFVGTIVSLDGRGKPKTIGGDLYRARLVRHYGLYPDGIPCKVIDHNNGTYTIRAPLVIPGELKLNVTLVNTIEGIMELIDQSDNLTSWGLQFLGVLNSSEVVKCNMSLPISSRRKDHSYCDYSNPRNKAPFFCDKPPSGVCTNVENLHYGDLDKKGSPKNTSLNYDKICKKHGCYREVDTQINITVGPRKQSLLAGLPSCLDQFQRSNATNQVTGFFEYSIWWSLTCATTLKTFSPTSLQFLKSSCLKDKALYFFGDSTIRNFFYFFVHKLNLRVDGPNQVITWHHPKIAFSKSNDLYNNVNLTLYFRAHGPPFFNTGTLRARPYISDSISGIQRGGKNVVVILNIGVHFSHHHPNIFIQRIKGIKKAILEHHKVHPETKFIYRGSNVVRRGNEWMLYRLEKIARKILQNIDNFLFLSLWDLTTVWPLNGNVHPGEVTLEREAQHMFNHVCDKILVAKKMKKTVAKTKTTLTSRAKYHLKLMPQKKRSLTNAPK